MISDLQEAFAFYDREETGLISINHFNNILKNFGFHRMTPRDIDEELRKSDPDIKKRNCVDFTFCKYVIGYRWTKSGRDEEARECCRVFDKRDRNVVSAQEIKTVLQEYISAQLTEAEI